MKIVHLSLSLLVASMLGCHSSSSTATSSDTASPLARATVQPAAGQPRFDTPEAALNALLDAAKAQDRARMRDLFGPAADDLLTNDPVADANSFKSFTTHALEQVRMDQSEPDTARLFIGKNEYPFPIPLVKSIPDGKWYFDTEAGKARILARKIGANELETIEVCKAYVQAQRQYATSVHDGSGVYQFAQRLVSHEGQKDGLYYPSTSEADQSPFGPLAAQAANEGYEPPKGAARQPFHGYYFRILKSQGANAPGGAYSYVINNHMIAGFALLAYPAKYGSSGVTTFIINHYGQLYQKDLGPQSDVIAPQITSYDPDSSWTPVQE